MLRKCTDEDISNEEDSVEEDNDNYEIWFFSFVHISCSFL